VISDVRLKSVNFQISSFCENSTDLLEPLLTQGMVPLLGFNPDEFLLNEHKSVGDLSQNLPRSVFMIRGAVELGNSPTSLVVFIQIPIAQFHIDEYEQQIREFPVIKYCNDIQMITSAEFCNHRDFILRSSVIMPFQDELSDKHLRSSVG
jgi:hypothetical protein